MISRCELEMVPGMTFPPEGICKCKTDEPF